MEWARSTRTYVSRGQSFKSSKRPISYPSDVKSQLPPFQAGSAQQQQQIESEGGFKKSGETKKDNNKTTAVNTKVDQLDGSEKSVSACDEVVKPAATTSSERSTSVKSLIPLSLKKLIKDYLMPNQSPKTKHK